MKKLGVVAATMVFLGAALSAAPAEAGASAPRGVVAPPDPAAFGRTVDATTGRPVPFVVVIAYQEDYATPITATISGPGGRFVLRGLDDEFALRFVGALTRHETGWQACDGSVVPSSGEACTQGPGNQGRISLGRL